MTAPPEPVRLVCPKCGSDRITSWETSYLGYCGVRFFQDPGDPTSIVVDYDGVYDTKSGEGGEYQNDLWCDNCDANMGEAALVPAGTPPNPDWEPGPSTPPLEPAAWDDKRAVDAIHGMLDARVWSGADDLEAIAEIIRLTGREVREPDEDPGDTYTGPTFREEED